MLTFKKRFSMIGVFVGENTNSVAWLVDYPGYGYVPEFTRQSECKINSDDMRQIADKLDELNGK